MSPILQHRCSAALWSTLWGKGQHVGMRRLYFAWMRKGCNMVVTPSIIFSEFFEMQSYNSPGAPSELKAWQVTPLSVCWKKITHDYHRNHFSFSDDFHYISYRVNGMRMILLWDWLNDLWFWAIQDDDDFTQESRKLVCHFFIFYPASIHYVAVASRREHRIRNAVSSHI